jgi:DNA-3-methyladenine glycosylase I
MSKHLRKLGFKFVGSTTMYALMQATGMYNDHAPGCFRRAELG